MDNPSAQLTAQALKYSYSSASHVVYPTDLHNHLIAQLIAQLHV